MKIDQILQTLSYGDAIGNHAYAIKDTLIANGYSSDLYAKDISERLPENSYHSIDDYNGGDAVIYHASIGGKVISTYANSKAKHIMIYHNVTPPSFFEEYDPSFAMLCKSGLSNIKKLKDYTDLVIAVSEFNKQDLLKMGYTCPIEVVPILIKFEDYAKEPSSKIINQYKDDGYTNILFTGRVAPNKKHEDLIESFYYYKKNINPKSRLILAGGYKENDVYAQKLKYYIGLLGVEDVVFTGHIPFDEILAYYKLADVFLCLSEHEGFCVPLVEAMYFDVPIIAYDSCAIKETLGGSGILLEDKSPNEVAKLIYLLMNDNNLRESVINSQRERLKFFDNNKIKKQFLDVIERYIDLK